MSIKWFLQNKGLAHMPTVSTILQIFQFRKKFCSTQSTSFQITSTFGSVLPKKHFVFIIVDLQYTECFFRSPGTFDIVASVIFIRF